MAFIKLNDLELEVEDGMNIIQVAQQVGIEVPHYCFHSGLSRPANCRMCLVEPHEFFPPAGKIVPARQLATGCTTTVRTAPEDRKLDGKYDFIVRTDSPRVKQARENILEFLLIHHPLDCPVCDQAGECKLQDFSFNHGRGTSRYIEVKNIPPKKDLGPEVLLYSTRCIVCTRCIRFCDEVTGTGELGVVHRGSKNEIDIPRKHDGTPTQLLDNKLSGNVVDICPVGALKSKDFLFKSRPWFMKTVNTVCAGCSVGCNITLDFKDDGVYRLKPRYHEHINQHWMCDDGRLGYHYVNSEDRLQTPMKRVDGSLVPTSWADAFGMILEKLSAVDSESMAIVGSSQITNEENYLLRKLADQLDVGTVGIFGRNLGDEYVYPKFTIEADKNPNTRGAKDMLCQGENEVLEGEPLWTGLSGKEFVYLVNGTPERPIDETECDVLEKIGFLVVQDVLLSEVSELADIVLPGATFAEKDGCFTNSQGWVQRIRKSISAPGQAQPDWEIIQQLVKKLGGDIDYNFVGEIALEIAEKVAGYKDANHQQIGDQGILIST